MFKSAYIKFQIYIYIPTDKAICAWKVRTSDQNLMASCHNGTVMGSHFQ